MAEQPVIGLGEILESRRRQIARARQLVPLETLKRIAQERDRTSRDFARAISGPGLRVIAEMKRASPTRGLICRNYRRREIARSYEAAGAAAISVLTEELYFRGSLDDLKVVRGSVKLPVLRKDFILDPYQMHESAAAGADAALLIVAALGDRDLRALIGLAEELQLAALVEVHTEQEVARAVDAGARIIGINNRNLKTMAVRIETSLELRKKIPADCLAVAESGIKTAEDLRRLKDAGFNAALIGERLMSAQDPGGELGRMLEAMISAAAPGKGGEQR